MKYAFAVAVCFFLQSSQAVDMHWRRPPPQMSGRSMFTPPPLWNTETEPTFWVNGIDVGGRIRNSQKIKKANEEKAAKEAAEKEEEETPEPAAEEPAACDEKDLEFTCLEGDKAADEDPVASCEVALAGDKKADGEEAVAEEAVAECEDALAGTCEEPAPEAPEVMTKDEDGVYTIDIPEADEGCYIKIDFDYENRKVNFVNVPK